MSIFISVTDPEACLLLSDAASYDDYGVVQALNTKIWFAQNAPVAITARGHAACGQAVARELLDVAEARGAAFLIDALPVLTAEFKAILGAQFVGSNSVQVLVAAFLPNLGGVHRTFATDVIEQGFNAGAFEVIEPPAVFATGAAVTTDDMIARGVPLRDESESMTAYVARVGADIMQVMRETPAPLHDQPDREPLFAAGGWVDLAICHPDGVSCRRIREWPDRVGEKIQPFGGRG